MTGKESPLSCRARKGRMRLEDMRTVHGKCQAQVRLCCGLRCPDDCLCRETDTHWARCWDESGLASYWEMWCDLHGLLGIDADAVMVDGKLLAEVLE